MRAEDAVNLAEEIMKMDSLDVVTATILEVYHHGQLSGVSRMEKRLAGDAGSRNPAHNKEGTKSND